MNRRNFFNKLGSFVVGCYLAFGLKPLEKETFYVLDIEVSFVFAPLPESMRKVFIPILYKRKATSDSKIMVPYSDFKKSLDETR